MTKFEAENAAYKLAVLTDLCEELSADTSEEAHIRIHVLLGIVTRLAKELHQHTEGGDKK